MIRLQCLCRSAALSSLHSLRRIPRRRIHRLFLWNYPKYYQRLSLDVYRSGSYRSYGTGMGFVPRGFIFRAFWTGVTAIIGFIYYKASQVSSWMNEQLDFAKQLGLEGLVGILGAYSTISEALDNIVQENTWEGANEAFSFSWNPFSWGRKETSAGNDAAVSKEDSKISSEKDDPSLAVHEQASEDGHFKEFIKKMIEVRNILKAADMGDSLTLPSIVVIGSQSSGKSSVLESIVGHEFLPKGQNMVTRRPLELTLVNSPQATRDYAVFEHLETGPVYDFGQVQKTLTEMNLAVPADQWISTKPIELTIYSRNVPDLSLVDLPGYIQINNRKQPAILRERIAQLCERYINKENIILAVCAADVDLANAESLKASRAVDPHGLRTIGVITKLDLVDPVYSAELIQNEDYPLRLGYVGVICRAADAAPQSKAISLLRGDSLNGKGNERYEDVYLREHHHIYGNVKGRVGINSLRDRLTKALEESMRQSLSSFLCRVHDELAELCYTLKVEYSDRIISPEGYVSMLAANVKNGLEKVARDYNRQKVRNELKRVLQERLLYVAEETVWPIAGKDGVKEQQLHQAVSSLTRSGVGRMATNCLVEAIMSQVKQIIKDGPLSHHSAAKDRLLHQVELAMRTASQTAIDQVENAIKPLKHQLDYSDEDWQIARSKLLRLFQETIQRLDRDLAGIQKELGQRRLRRIVQQLNADPLFGSELGSVTGPTTSMIERAKEAVRINFRLKGLRQRIGALETAECLQPVECHQLTGSASWWEFWRFAFGRSGNQDMDINMNTGCQSMMVDEGLNVEKRIHLWNPCQTRCPEIYLYLMMERLLGMASLYVHHELVQEFLHPFPDQLISSLAKSKRQKDESLEAPGPLGLDKKEILEFVHENPTVARHLQLLERRKILELVRERLTYLQHLKADHDQE